MACILSVLGEKKPAEEMNNNEQYLKVILIFFSEHKLRLEMMVF